ncbi:MAG: glycosyltransferase [Gammaproteobacteria bacterium]|nr:glycosyltransferase [Gammaproteobacteria bacterium]
MKRPIPSRLDDARVLIYSHDTFGLGHLRRCRAIAHELVGRFKGISVLILSGSPVVGGFEFRARVDFVRIPGVIKLKDGSYTSLGLHIDLDQTMAMREAIIRQTAEVFRPDLFLVDKEPLGLEGEVGNTLELLRARGARTVLGLRDVLDEPAALRREWQRKSACPAVRDLYDEVWIYGREAFYHPLRGLDLGAGVEQKTIFTGYLKRPSAGALDAPHIGKPYILVSPGGGKDGEEMVELTLQALSRCQLKAAVLVVLGPFMDEHKRLQFKRRSRSAPNMTVLDYHPRIESLIENAAGLVTMGGYNIFCEILSFDRPAIVLPRFEPRAEQLIRARRAAQLGLVTILEPRHASAEKLLPLLENLTAQPRPSDNLPAGMLDGMDAVCARVARMLGGDAGN